MKNVFKFRIVGLLDENIPTLMKELFEGGTTLSLHANRCITAEEKLLWNKVSP